MNNSDASAFSDSSNQPLSSGAAAKTISGRHKVGRPSLADRYAGLDKREQILSGAMRTFLQLGYDAASMDNIAMESGVSKQTVYSYFQDKDTLFRGLVERVLARYITVDFSPQLLQMETAAALTKFATIFMSRMDDWEYIAFARLLIGESGRFPELAQLYMKTVIVPGNQMMTHYFAQRLNWPDAEAAVRVYLGSMSSYMTSQEILFGKYHMVMPRDRFIKTLVDMVMSAGTK